MLRPSDQRRREKVERIKQERDEDGDGKELMNGGKLQILIDVPAAYFLTHMLIGNDDESKVSCKVNETIND